MLDLQEIFSIYTIHTYFCLVHCKKFYVIELYWIMFAVFFFFQKNNEWKNWFDVAFNVRYINEYQPNKIRIFQFTLRFPQIVFSYRKAIQFSVFCFIFFFSGPKIVAIEASRLWWEKKWRGRRRRKEHCIARKRVDTKILM